MLIQEIAAARLKEARDRLRSVVNNIAEVESTCDFAPGVGGATSAQEQATQVKHELEELQREKEVLTAEILQELGIRPSESWSEGLPPFVPSASGSTLGLSGAVGSSRDIGGAGSSRGFGLFPRPDRASWKTFAPTVQAKKEVHLPRLPSGGNLDNVYEVRPARMLPLPPTWRTTDLHHEHDCNGRTQRGTLSHDRTTPISSHPWPRASICGSGSGNTSGDATFDAGAGWGNIMDDSYVPTPTAFGYAASDAPASAGVAVVGRSSGSGSVGTSAHGRQQQQQHRPSSDNGSSPPRVTTTSTADPAEEERTPPWVEHPAAADPVVDRAVDGYSSQGKRRRADSDVHMDADGAVVAGGGAGRASPSCLNSSNSNAVAIKQQQQQQAQHSWGEGVSSPCSLSNSDGPPQLLPNMSALFGGSNGSNGSGGTAHMPAGSLPAAVGVVGGGTADAAWQALGAAAASRAALESTGHPPAGSAAGRSRLLRRPGPTDHHIGYPERQLPIMTAHSRFVTEHTTPMNVRDGRSGGFGKFAGDIVSPSCRVAETQAPVSYSVQPTSGLSGSLLLSIESHEHRDNIRVADNGSTVVGKGPGTPGGGSAEWRPQAGRAEERRREGGDVPTPATSGSSTGRGCQADGCDRRPIYAYKGSKKAAYCAKHRVAGMVDTRHPLCKNEQCTRQPSFGMEGDRRASYCAEHKLTGMINVASRRCQHPGCLRHPNFGFPGDRRASYCSGHRETGMVDIVSRRCRDPSCGRRPLYNMDGLRPVCCSQHKAPGMIDVVSTRCQEPGCFCHPSFGYASDKKARRCARHRLENMEGVKGHRQKRRKEASAATTTNSITTSTPTSITTSSPPSLIPPGDHTAGTSGLSSNAPRTQVSAGAGAVRELPSSGLRSLGRMRGLAPGGLMGMGPVVSAGGGGGPGAGAVGLSSLSLAASGAGGGMASRSAVARV